jgi:hypothetical protein
MYSAGNNLHEFISNTDNIAQFLKEFREIANVALRNIVHTHHQGVLYFENGVGLHGTRINVISYSQPKKRGQLCARSRDQRFSEPLHAYFS